MKHLKKPTKQDEIIKLLKEIRDRLPLPAVPRLPITWPDGASQNNAGQVWCGICGFWIYPNQTHQHQVTYQKHT